MSVDPAPAGGAALARQHEVHGVQPVLPVPDVPAAAEWFCRVLGFSIDFLHGEPPFYGRVKLGDRSHGDPVFIHLQQQGGAITPCGETRLHVGRDLAGLHAHALAQRAEVVDPPKDQPWGLREFSLRAPGGHLIVLGAEVATAAPAASPRTVIAVYRPKPDAAEALLDLVRTHVPTLQRLGLATDRAPFVMRAADGTLAEVFEWASAEAIGRAHEDPTVGALWQRFDALCTFVPLASLPEADSPFAEFEAV